jgi:hypothetical protein
VRLLSRPRRAAPRRLVRRLLAVTAVSLPLLATTLPAQARTCAINPDVNDTWITYPCPGPQDDPVAAPVWVTTEEGPGYHMTEWSFIKVTKGSHVYLVNTSTDRARIHGIGFDSGMVPAPNYAEVLGVPALAVGSYAIYDEDDKYAGSLEIEP